MTPALVRLLPLLLVLVVAGCQEPGPSLEEGRKLLQIARESSSGDAVDTEVEALLADWDLAALGTDRKELKSLQARGRRARIQALLIDIQLSQRDVSPQIEQARELAARWGVDLAELDIRLEFEERKADEATLVLVRRRGYLLEARYWVAEAEAAEAEPDRIGNLAMARQYLDLAEGTPEEIGVTDSRLKEYLTR